MGIFGWLAIVLLVIYGFGFFFKLGTLALTIILILAALSLVGSIFSRRKAPRK